MDQPLLTEALRRRFAALGPQSGPDAVVVAHFVLPGASWEWWALAYDENGGVPQLFCLVRGRETELGYVGLAELGAARSPLGLPVERDQEWEECTLAELHCRLAGERTRQVRPRGYWRRGEDWWTEEEAEDGLVPSDAEYVVWEEGP